jgi:ubiquinone/menaquinone biosynthesis C-methylase UbiE
MAAPYANEYAELYDMFYRSKPYAAEAAFIHRLLRTYGILEGARVLELACGTGGHAMKLAKRGYRITATDSSTAMIALARRKSERQRLSIQFEPCDMRKLPAQSLKFDAALCLFDSIGYVKTDRAIADVLNNVHRSLRFGGLFALEFWHAPAMVNGFDPVRVRRFRSGKTTLLRISETELQPTESLANITYNVYELRDDLSYRHFRERHTNRYFTVTEMERLARKHGFTPLASYDGFRRAAVSNATWHVVTIWRKNAADTVSRRHSKVATLQR